MSVHEFVTITAFYLESLPDSVCSKPLAMALLTKTQEAVTDFNEMQLHLLKTTLEMMFRKERGKYQNEEDAKSLMFNGDEELAQLVESTYKEI